MTASRVNRALAIALPERLALLSSNQRQHWAAKAKRTRMIRDAAAWAARSHRAEPMSRVCVTAVIHPKTARRFDPHNYQPTVKAAIDGLVDAGLLVDDDSKRVVSVAFRAGPKSPQGWRVELHVEEVA